jgi:putative aminopeptidase FrvX
VDYALLKQLCETPGIAAHEDRVLDLAAAALRPLVDELSSDALGNVIGIKKGSGGPRVMVAAHADEIGFLVKFIDDRGFLRVQPVGGWDPRNLMSQRVLVHARDGKSYRGALQIAAKPIHLLDPSEIKNPKVDEFFIDLGLPAEKAKSLIEIGDMVTMDRTLEENEYTVISKSLDDRVAVFVLIEAIRKLGATNAEIVAVVSTQEEVGLRGAASAAFHVEPDVAIGLDVTLAVDIPGAPVESAVTRLGEGTAIKIFDSSMVSHPKVVRKLRDLAEQKGIKHQLEVLPRGGTDGGAMQLARGGAPAATISIPTRYIHTPNEMCVKADIEATIDLLAAFLEDAGSHDFRYKIA